MATVLKLGGAADTNSGTHTVTATPAYGDLVVIVTSSTGNTSAVSPTDNNASSPGDYTEISACACVKVSSADQMRLFIRNNLIFNASSTVFTHAPGASSGGGLNVLAVRGLRRTGQNAARQAAKQDNQASGTPTVVLGAAALTGNCLVGAVFNGTNPCGVAQPSNWSSDTNSGYNNPATGIGISHINSGETGSSIAWVGSSASAFCACVCELDCSAEASSDNITTEPVTPKDHV